MTTAADIAKAWGGAATSAGWLCRCPMPDHGKGRGDLRPSLSVTDGESEPVFYCHAGCDNLAVKALARRHGLLAAFDGQRLRAAAPASKPRPVIHTPNAEALAIWRGARHGGDVLANYLRDRGITLDAPPTLRQGTTLVHGRMPVPTMVAAVQAPDRAVIAVQELKLTWGGAKAPVTCPRITTGSLGAGAVRLAAAGPVLGLAEGIETGLAAMQLHDVPVWVALGGQRLAKIALPPEVERVVIFGDRDPAGELAAGVAAAHYSARGLSVDIRLPPEGYGDWNDVVSSRAPEGVA